MTVPYSLDSNNNNNSEEKNLFIKVLTHDKSEKSLIHFNLNLIQCSNKEIFNWTSVESTSTLRGEFVRTTFLDKNIMYLSSGVTYLRNLTTTDCLTKTMYRTDDQQLFEINLKIESTVNDHCSTENLCYPVNIYQCNYEKQRCMCRSPLQSYLTNDDHLICLHAVKNINQCTMNNVRCLEWCHQNSSSPVCICPNDVSKKKYSDNNRAYCEGQTNGLCNSFIQCPLGHVCLEGLCENMDYKFMSFDIITISIIISSLILTGIIIILGIKKQQINIPTTSDYDNVVYGVFRNNIQFSSITDDNIHDSSPFNLSDSASYRPKIVFLGGEQQLTAIYA